MLSALTRLFNRRPNKPDFVRKLLANLERRGAPAFVYQPEQDCLVHGDGTYQLGNAYLRYSQAESADRPALLEHFTTSVMETLDPPPRIWAVAKQRIVPLVRNGAMLDLMRFGADAGFAAGSALPFGEDLEPLQINFGIDNQASVAHVSAELFETWSQPKDVLLSEAISNLSRMVEWEWAEASPGAFVLHANEYVECLPLLPQFVQSLPFADRTVLAMPCRGHVLACDGSNDSLIVGLCSAAEQRMRDLPWPLTERLIQHVDGAWRPYRPTSPSAQRAVDRLTRIGQLGDYSAQQEALESALAAREEDIFVASYTLTELDIEGESVARSYCVWTEEVDSLLPITDVVAFVGETAPLADKPIFVRWKDVIDVAGRHLEACGYRPERFRVRTFPSTEELTELTQRAVELGGSWRD